MRPLHNIHPQGLHNPAILPTPGAAHSTAIDTTVEGTKRLKMTILPIIPPDKDILPPELSDLKANDATKTSISDLSEIQVQDFHNLMYRNPLLTAEAALEIVHQVQAVIKDVPNYFIDDQLSDTLLPPFFTRFPS